jgi:ribokinase
MTFDITTIGTATIDTFLELDNVCYRQDKKKGTGYYCFPIGGKALIKNLQEHIGGNAANTAVGFSRLKLKSAIVTSLNHSKNSRHITEFLRKEKVETKFIRIDPRAKVNLSYILDWHKNKNDRAILSYHQPKNFKKLTWPKTKWVYLTSLGEYFKEVVRQLPKEVKIAWNPGGSAIKQGLRFLLPVLGRAEILIMNKEEAAMLLSVDSRKSQNYEFLLNTLLKLGVKCAAITNGRGGAYAKKVDNTEVDFVPSLKVDVSEVTGAGDAFAAGFVCAYIKRKKIIDCLRWGNLNASFCIQRIGAWNGLLKLRELQKKFRELYR